jgi:hypothetical protein
MADSMTVSAASKATGIPERTIRRWIVAGRVGFL